MHLNQLLDGICSSGLGQDPQITGLCQDSRQLKPGDLFFAYPGVQSDGRNFLNEAIEKGAAAILLESDARSTLSSSVPLIPIAHLTHYMGLIAARFFAYPSQQLPVVGITGTNGKTSCTHFLAQCLQQLGRRCGVIGTLGNGFYGHLEPTQLTTPDAIELQQLLAALLKGKADAVLMEVSSHRLAQQRLNGMEFSIAAFTNLTRDHLDYHGSLLAYAQAKRSLFDLPGVEHAVLNADDPYGKAWLSELAGKLPVIAYSIAKPPAALPSIPQVWVKHYEFKRQGLKADIATPWGDISIENPFLIGTFNLSNLLLVLTTLKLLDFSLSDIAKVISGVEGVKGRMQAFHRLHQPLVVVDYAHTPDALQQTLKTLRTHCRGSLYCVFGCGGDRDKGKRPLMATVAEQHADSIVITNDNPRFEDPNQIIQEIQQGLTGAKPVYVEPDRRLAISYAIQNAKVEDVILIAGKGHENYQLIGGIKHPFSDTAEVEGLLNPDKA